MRLRDLITTLACLCIVAASATALFYWLGNINPHVAAIRWVAIPLTNIIGVLLAAHVLYAYKHPEQESEEDE